MFLVLSARESPPMRWLDYQLKWQVVNRPFKDRLRSDFLRWLGSPRVVALRSVSDSFHLLDNRVDILLGVAEPSDDVGEAATLLLTTELLFNDHGVTPSCDDHAKDALDIGGLVVDRLALHCKKNLYDVVFGWGKEILNLRDVTFPIVLQVVKVALRLVEFRLVLWREADGSVVA